MLSKNRLVLLCFLNLCLTACQSPKTLYHWNDYSETLYEFQKNPSADTQQAHIEGMLEIVEEAEEDNLLVPPGVYFELGIYFSEQGQKDKAKAYFAKELECFPESEKMIELAQSEIKS
tara:strand:- start:3793 stop:4146 length:354 start_codon:yes stop_codon:yes gene_type:complete